MNIPIRIKSLFFLLLSAIFISASGPTIAKLIIIGDNHLINGHNPISFCNVLFASSIIALLTLSIIYFNEIKHFKPTTLSKSSWCLILTSAFLSGCIVPTLYFFGIMYGNIINVILISTLQTPLLMLLGWIIFKQKPTVVIVYSAILTTIGVTILLLLPKILSTEMSTPPQTIPNKSLLASIPYIGDIFIFLAIVFSSIANIIVFKAIESIPNSVFNVLSMGIGSIIFFIIVITLFGIKHFTDLFSPFLWQWMIFYGSVIISMRIYFKFLGMKNALVSDVAISNSLSPLSAILFSSLILNVMPQPSQIGGGLLIFSGIGLALFEKLKVKPVPNSIKQ